MGLIRTTLTISTVGVVNPRSRKQRVAAAQLREMKAQTALLQQIADPGKAERERDAKEAKIAELRARRDAARAARADEKARRQAR